MGIYGWSYQSGGTHYHRIGEPLRVAQLHGIDTATGQALDNETVEKHDTILAHMLWDERASEAWQKLARQGATRLVLDIDDLMWHPDYAPFTDHYTPATLERLFANIRAANVVTVPSAYLAEQIAPINPNVWVVPNTIPEYLLRINNPRPFPDDRRFVNKKDPRFVIGYQGSPSHSPDFPDWLMTELWETLSELDGRWRYHFWGPDEIPGWPPAQTGHTPWQPIRKYHHSVSMDIGIGPLKDTPFNRAKSALRAQEYAALGIVGVFSPMPEYRRYVEHGETGIIVEPGGSWKRALLDLARDPIGRARMGQAARERAAAWTTEACITNWTDAWNSV